MGLRLTPRAEARVLEYPRRRGSGLGLRVGVTETGCAGYTYVLDYAYDVGSDDLVLRQNELNEQFVVTNTNATGECGWGESFPV